MDSFGVKTKINFGILYIFGLLWKIWNSFEKYLQVML